MNEKIYNINLIKECKPRFFPNIKQLEGQWKETTKNQIEAVKKLSKLDHESYWQFLVKPYSQQMALCCLTNSTQNMVPPPSNVAFMGQLRSKVIDPSQVNPMLDICELKSSIPRKDH